MKKDLEPLALGSALLGSGGGGDPAYELMMASHLVEELTILEMDDLKPDCLVAPIAFMGAPLVTIEKIHSGLEFGALVREIEKQFGSPPDVLMAAEVGGANVFTPLIASALLGIPVLDADTLGRAFPELQMSSCNLKGISPSPAFLAGSMGQSVAISPRNAYELESVAREITVQWGSSAAVAVYLMRGHEARDGVIAGTVSQALAMGEDMLSGGVDFLLQNHGGKRLMCGKITDIDQMIEDGFLRGKVIVKNADEEWTIEYQNEFLVAKKEGKVMAGCQQFPLEIFQR